jgi:hypothetical protein
MNLQDVLTEQLPPSEWRKLLKEADAIIKATVAEALKV